MKQALDDSPSSDPELSSSLTGCFPSTVFCWVASRGAIISQSCPSVQASSDERPRLPKAEIAICIPRIVRGFRTKVSSGIYKR